MMQKPKAAPVTAAVTWHEPPRGPGAEAAGSGFQPLRLHILFVVRISL